MASRLEQHSLFNTQYKKIKWRQQCGHWSYRSDVFAITTPESSTEALSEEDR